MKFNKTKEIEKIREEIKRDNTPLTEFKRYIKSYKSRKIEELTAEEYDDLINAYIEYTYEIRFLYEKDNICNCENCPKNMEYDNWQDRYPCGQWNCWVALH